MRFSNPFLWFSLVALAACSPATAQPGPLLAWITNSFVKLQQLIGERGTNNGTDIYATDTDRQTGLPLLNQTYARYQVGGTDLGYSFENGNNQLIFLFGDTLYFKGGDTMAWSSSPVAENGLLLNFFTNRDGRTLLVQPTNVDMGPFNVPNAGISLEGKTYIVCKTGYTNNSDTNAFSVLTRFEETNNTFITTTKRLRKVRVMAGKAQMALEPIPLIELCAISMLSARQ